MRHVIRLGTDTVTAEATRLRGRSAASAVRRQAPALQASIGTELLMARREARLAGRQRLESELDATFPMMVTGAELDAAAAFIAAAGLTAAWGSAALSALAAGATLGRVPTAIGSNVDRTVATEVARAFNDERDAILVDFGSRFGADRDPSDEGRRPQPGIFKLYSAVLDGKTCQKCFGADGEIVEPHQSFKAGTPPQHPWCRCLVEHVIVPKPARLEDIIIDYELFKEELRDVIREGRIVSDRQALSFVSDSLGSKRSPEVLTKRFHDEAYATRRSDAGGSGGRPPTPPPPGGGGSGGGGGGKPRSELDPKPLPGQKVQPPWYVDATPREPGRDYDDVPRKERFKHAHERRIAEKLRLEGNNVWALHDDGVHGDAVVNGTPPGTRRTIVEFKSALRLYADVKTPHYADRIVMSAKLGQARSYILDLRDTRGIEQDAKDIARRVRESRVALDYLRIVGDTFDITFHGF